MKTIAACERSVTLVMGSKNVGKSMFCRGLLNSLLNHTPKVAFLDLDVGQGEFTTEGILSLTVVTEPQIRTSSVPNIDSTSR